MRALAGIIVVLSIFSLQGASLEAKTLKKPAVESKQKAEKTAKENPQTKSFQYSKMAVAAAKDGKWGEAKSYAKQSGNRETIKLIYWLQYTQSDADDGAFKEISSFIKENPSWPSQDDLWNAAERNINNNVPPKDIVAWFSNRKPETRKGMEYLAGALRTVYPSNKAMQQQADKLISQAWVQGNFTTEEENEFFKEYQKRLTTQDHVDRINRLLWDERTPAAEKLLYLVSGDHKDLFEARIHLIRKNRNAYSYVKNVAAKLRNDEGLQYELARWYYSKQKDDDVVNILVGLPEKLKFPEKWWTLRSIEVREMILRKEYQKAYDIASRHQLTAGNDFADGEWISGWVALRFLKKYETAYNHFYKLYHNVKMPISLARASYWAGRAAEAGNQSRETVDGWYSTAASFPATFYGQLASLKLGRKEVLLPAPLVPNEEEKAAARKNELMKVFHLLASINEMDMAKRFLITAAATSKSPGEVREIMNVAAKIKPDLVVFIAKNSPLPAISAEEFAYPIIEDFNLKKFGSTTEPALVHAIIRQESMFNKDAQSPVGASGMMQLMPATAKSTAARMGLSYNKSKLTSNPDFNVRLGSFYINDMISNFDGSYVMAIAAYNAGQGNVRKWQQSLGDPKNIKNSEVMIDWVEMIPFKETRNYVQRVTEGLQVYRYLLAKHNLKENQKVISMNFIDKDLIR